MGFDSTTWSRIATESVLLGTHAEVRGSRIGKLDRGVALDFQCPIGRPTGEG